MKELEKKEATNNFNVVSTFSGAGGSCMGLKLAGFNVLWANEFIPAAQEVYQANHKNTYLEKKDIRTINAKSILEKCNLKKGELDLFEGSPPCASFSQAGLGDTCWGQVKKYSSTTQRTDDLFIEYARLLKDLQPKLFITENVPALSNNRNKIYFNTICSHLINAGYKLKAYIFNSANYGVPQKRQRLFFIGIRNDLNVSFTPPPINKKYIKIKQAIPEYNKEIPNLNLQKDSVGYKLLKIAQKRGDDSFDKASQILKNKSGWFNHGIVYPHKISPTILAGRIHLYHNIYPRYLSIPELKRIQTFPDDFKIYGSFSTQWERIGRSVPPRMMEQIGLQLKETLEEIT